MGNACTIDRTESISDIDDTKFVEREKIRSSEVKPDFSLPVRDTPIIDLTLNSSDDEDEKCVHKKGVKPDFSLPVQDTTIIDIDLTLNSSNDEDAKCVHKKGISESGLTHLH